MTSVSKYQVLHGQQSWFSLYSAREEFVLNRRIICSPSSSCLQLPQADTARGADDQIEAMASWPLIKEQSTAVLGQMKGPISPGSSTNSRGRKKSICLPFSSSSTSPGHLSSCYL